MDQGSSDKDAEHVARVLLSRGSRYEGIALLRGAVARDATEERCSILLGEVLAGRIPEQSGHGPSLNLALVDRWIRGGMLVEALALLGGTPMASEETGREWANLLGELLAPVPVDAEETLVEMHRQLLTGGASVALTLLEERARREPALPAWATRRLELLRWMLLDNATAAESHPELSGECSTAFATMIRDAVNRRNLVAARDAAQLFTREQPGDPSPPRVARALDAILGEIERHRADASVNAHTLPMFGHPAAAMQLRMGNLAQAAISYRKLYEKDTNDLHALELSEHVEAVLRAARGEPAVDASYGESDDSPMLVTSVTALPDHLMRRDKSGSMRLSTAPELGFDDEETTTQIPSAEDEAERLAATGNLEEAEGIFRALAEAQPENKVWAHRADELKAQREGREPGVLVRIIRAIE